MTKNVVFAKTEHGRAELTNRSGKLTPRERRVLILVDGRNTVDDIRDLVNADDLTHTLGMLEEAGLIELHGKRQPDGGVAQANEALPSITAFSPLPAVHDEKRFDMARHFMINTIKTFCGRDDHFSLQYDIFNAGNHEKLRTYFDPWYNAIVKTIQGRRRAEELRAELLKVI